MIVIQSRLNALRKLMKERGMDVDTDATTVEEAKASILQALERLDK